MVITFAMSGDLHRNMGHEWQPPCIETLIVPGETARFFYMSVALPIFRNRQSGYNNRNKSGICRHQLIYHFGKLFAIAFC